ncbi:MAG: amidohydrolase family protein [Erythrobacter sp.]
MIRTIAAAVALCLVGSISTAAPAFAQTTMEQVPDRPTGEGEGPYETLLIRGATMIDGTGAPPEGPVDIIIRGNRIAGIVRGGGSTIAADHVVEADGMYVMPGFVDTHGHNGDPGKAPQPSYGYKLWLAHGVTSVRGVPFYFLPDARGVSDAARSAANTITAPRLFPYAVFGTGDFTPTEAGARAWVQNAKARGFVGVKFFNFAPPELVRAGLDEAEKIGMGTVAHLGQRGVAGMNAAQAATSGLQSITHFYGHFESLLREGTVPQYPADYNYLDEQSRFSWAARITDQAVEPGSDAWNEYVDLLLAENVTLAPTFNIYSASRDVMKARNADWHDRYTLSSLMRFFEPSLVNHGSYYHDWTSEDEIAWRRFYQRWFALTRDFKDRGGRVTAGSDPGYIYQTWGFSYISELEMLREAGLSPLEVIQAATQNGAAELYEASGEAPPFGVIRPGMLADLVIVPENPLANLKVLYGTGHRRLNRETDRIETVGGVRWTVKDGIVYDAPALLADVARMVEQQEATP